MAISTEPVTERTRREEIVQRIVVVEVGGSRRIQICARYVYELESAFSERRYQSKEHDPGLLLHHSLARARHQDTFRSRDSAPKQEVSQIHVAVSGSPMGNASCTGNLPRLSFSTSP